MSDPRFGKPVAWRRWDLDRDSTGLTSVQRDTLHWLASDRTVQEIADVLGMSRGSFKRRVSLLFEALGVHARRDAVRRGRELGVLDAEDAP